MSKILIFLQFLFLNSTVFAQNYSEEIKDYREKYKQDFLTDDHSPIHIEEDLKYIQFFEPDEMYQVIAAFTKTENAAPFDMATMSGKTKKYIEYGKLTFILKDQSYTLTVFQGLALLEKPELKDYLFVPFTDLTNGGDSYINGRYLDFRIGDIKENKLLVDFNKAYNPYCAFSDGYNCPKPPEENNLKVGVRAGEKKYAKNH